MFKVPIKLIKPNIPLVYEHIGLWNENNVQLGKQFGIGKLGFGGSYARLNNTSGFYEGFANFIEPPNYGGYQLSKLAFIKFEWLLELLNITSISESEIEYAVHPYLYAGGSVPQWQRESGQPNNKCCVGH